MNHGNRRFDVVVFGATSFVGQILCNHLVERHGTRGPLRWAIAGRSASKLVAVARETGADVEQIVADAHDEQALADLAASTRVVASTVGPYALYGSPLVNSVVEAGTDYCDLTGETQWMRRMIDAHEGAARSSGARVVHTCGFDSIPSDLGVWFTQQQAMARFGTPCTRISMRVQRMKGGASGGTIASMVNLVTEMRTDPSLRALLADPYALNPADLRSGPPQADSMLPGRDKRSGEWLAPFVMAAVNTRVVQRTHALLGRPWGQDFRYDETMATGSGPLGALKAGTVAGGLAASIGVMAFGPTRNLALRVLPKSGEGPSPEAQLAGGFDVRFHGTTAAGERITTRVTGDRDPGYGATARMLGESAACLLDVPHDEIGGGFWTPATALGERLLERLEAHAGMRFDILD